MLDVGQAARPAGSSIARGGRSGSSDGREWRRCHCSAASKGSKRRRVVDNAVDGVDKRMGRRGDINSRRRTAAGL